LPDTIAHVFSRPLSKLISNLIPAAPQCCSHLAAAIFVVFGSMHLLCIIYTRCHNGVNDVASNQINVRRSSVVSRCKDVFYDGTAASLSLSFFSSSFDPGETAAEMIFAMQRHVQLATRSRELSEKEQRERADTPIGLLDKNSEISI